MTDYVDTCERCGEAICKHGVCYCDEERGCSKCHLLRDLEREVEREIAWQRDVVGLLCGFTEPPRERRKPMESEAEKTKRKKRA